MLTQYSHFGFFNGVSVSCCIVATSFCSKCRTIASHQPWPLQAHLCRWNFTAVAAKPKGSKRLFLLACFILLFSFCKEKWENILGSENEAFFQELETNSTFSLTIWLPCVEGMSYKACLFVEKDAKCSIYSHFVTSVSVNLERSRRLAVQFKI